MTDVTKVTVNLPSDVVEDLRELAEANHTTMTEAIRQSIKINKYLHDQEKADAKILIETPDGKYKQIVRK
jgi:predicted transcriptional regulator